MLIHQLSFLSFLQSTYTILYFILSNATRQGPSHIRPWPSDPSSTRGMRCRPPRGRGGRRCLFTTFRRHDGWIRQPPIHTCPDDLPRRKTRAKRVQHWAKPAREAHRLGRGASCCRGSRTTSASRQTSHQHLRQRCEEPSCSSLFVVFMGPAAA